MAFGSYRSAWRLMPLIMMAEVRGGVCRLSASLGEDANVINDVVVNHPASQQAQTEIGHLV